MTSQADRSLPLAGIRAIEVGEIWAGPFCGQTLADLGAEVIKVESIQRTGRGNVNPKPGSSDHPNGEPGERPWNRGASFNTVNRSKLGITLDLASRQGSTSFKDLVSVSDIVFSNYSFGVMDRFGLGYAELRRARPDVVVLFMPGYGCTGPYVRYRSMGMTVDAITGHTALRGYPDLGLDRNTMVHHADAVGGATAAFAICTALHLRARKGKGQFIDLSQGECFTSHMGEVFLEYQMTGHQRERRGNRDPKFAPSGCYPCAGDDRWVTIAVRGDDEWEAFKRTLGDPRLNDESFDTLRGRLVGHDELDAIISDWTLERDRHEVTAALQAEGIPASPVLNCHGDTYDDPHLQARGFFGPVDPPEAGEFVLSGKMWTTARHPDRGQWPAPCLGEHNGPILGDLLGYSRSILADLEAAEVIGTVPLQGADMGGVRRAGRR